MSRFHVKDLAKSLHEKTTHDFSRVVIIASLGCVCAYALFLSLFRPKFCCKNSSDIPIFSRLLRRRYPRSLRQGIYSISFWAVAQPSVQKLLDEFEDRIRIECEQNDIRLGCLMSVNDEAVGILAERDGCNLVPFQMDGVENVPNDVALMVIGVSLDYQLDLVVPILHRSAIVPRLGTLPELIVDDCHCLSCHSSSIRC